MKKVRFGDVASRLNIKVDQATTALEYYIGGEHIESSELLIHSKAPIKGSTIGYQFQFGFRKGDILFMTKNPHLRKTSMVDFDGLCSIATFVIHSNDENVLLQDYLLMEMQTDRFWDYCESHKSGGVNFFINWGTLSNYEFSLPTIEEQKSLVDRMWAAYRVKESYRTLIKATDEMVKSRFIEQFGGNDTTLPLSEWIGTTFPGEWGTDDIDGTGVKVIRTTNFTNTGKLDLTNVVTRNIETDKVQKKQLKPGDIILERSGGTADNPVGRVVYFEAEGIYLFNNFTQLLRCKNGVNSLYVFYSLFNYYQTHKNEIRSMGNKTTGIQNLKMDKYWEIPIVDASSESQEEFVSLYRQADKSKFELKQAIEKIDKVMRALLQ